MRVFASLLAASMALASPAAASPRRVASLNLCTDELVLAIATPDQIVSVTHLSQDEAETPMWRRGRQYARNDGSLLSAVALRPDLVVTMGGGVRDRSAIAARLGIPTLDLPFAASLDDVEANIRRVATALGQPARGAALIRRIESLRATAPRQRADSIWLGGGGRTVNPAGLEAQWMALAGLAQRPMRGDRVSLETLIVHPPAVLLRSDYRRGQYSNGQRWLDNPAVRHARASRTIATDGRLWTCMGPLLINEVERLRRELAR